MAAPHDFHLERFVAAQDHAGTYERALAELRAGRKTGHWMWFVFPQLAGLGRSEMAVHYALGSIEEARAYLTHPVLGARLRECAAAVADIEGRTAEQVLGATDAMKLRSSMTLFARAAPDDPMYPRVLEHWYDGRPDPVTEELLDR